MIKIPPRSENIINIKTDPKISGDLYFQHRTKKENEQWEDFNKLEMAEICANIKKKKFPVRIKNYEDKPVTIWPGTVMGEVMEVEIQEPDMEGVKL